ncbi:hypothetical protein WKW80_05635 [Variovorax humicola]|uniref:Uncharacterized protein n=1 Tax=Variovorax humicola TaxID=1769758 RepID=A0ABU8VUT9_9BURK
MTSEKTKTPMVAAEGVLKKSQTSLNSADEDANAKAPHSEEKQFAILVAQYALKGHALFRGNPADGAAVYYAMRWGMVKMLPTLEAARAFLSGIGGAQ